MENPEQITAALKQFIGSGIIYQHWLGIRFTEGVKYLADAAEAYWLIDPTFRTQICSTRLSLNYIE
jgi:hypothetical protein